MVSFEKVFANIGSAVEKLKNFCDENAKQSSTIVHSEVYPSESDAKKADEDFTFRAWFSAQKEFERRTKGL